jgi:hypothetical protein
VPKITTISVEYQRKFNLGQYESATVGATLWADVDETEDPQVATRELFDTVKTHVREQSLPLMKLRTEQVNEILSGLPPDLQAAVRAGLNGKSVSASV